VEPIVGKILAGWRYDISGLAPEMREDYEQHFADCEHCRSRQKIHRIIDISLIVLASASAAVFLRKKSDLKMKKKFKNLLNCKKSKNVKV